MVGIIQRAGHACGQFGSLRFGELCGGFAVPMLRGGFRTVNAVAPFDNVQIQFVQAVFVGGGFQHGREHGFFGFAEIAAAFVQKQVFRQLLADGGAARADFAAAFVALHGIFDAVPVKAAVFGKARVF